MRDVFQMKSSPLLVKRFIATMIAAAAKGTAAAVTGLYISYHFNLPAGPAMTLVTSGILVLAASFRRRIPARECSSNKPLGVLLTRNGPFRGTAPADAWSSAVQAG